MAATAVGVGDEGGAPATVRCVRDVGSGNGLRGRACLESSRFKMMGITGRKKRPGHTDRAADYISPPKTIRISWASWASWALTSFSLSL